MSCVTSTVLEALQPFLALVTFNVYVPILLTVGELLVVVVIVAPTLLEVHAYAKSAPWEEADPSSAIEVMAHVSILLLPAFAVGALSSIVTITSSEAVHPFVLSFTTRVYVPVLLTVGDWLVVDVIVACESDAVQR